ncbi:MAG: DUF4118 domain-containing protein [Geobacteraceae bacterium]|nr:DUF4118 domain-containing protein [Geobacteraceae bacterium]
MKSAIKYFACLLLVMGATAVGEIVRLHLSPPNMVMLYLLAVVLAALRLGLRPAIVTAALGVLAFDFFFVPPRFSFTVQDKEYLITFFALFGVGLVISTLVSRFRQRTEELAEREAETAALYRLSRDIASAPDSSAVYSAIVHNAAECFQVEAALMIPIDGALQVVEKNGELEITAADIELAKWSFKSLRKAGHGSGSYSDSSAMTLPFVVMGECIAILILFTCERGAIAEKRLNRIVEGFAIQLKMALVRLELAQQAEAAQVVHAREKLERALLNSVSHDLRTPLATVTGVLTSLKEDGGHLSDRARLELLDTACSEAERLNRFVGNLLDMTRIEAGAVRLRLEPCDVQDLVGCAIGAVEQRLGNLRIDVKLADNLPLVMMDMVLMTQVLVNLLDNARKYAPLKSRVEISANADKNWLYLAVSDQGGGLPGKDLQHIFDKFYRVPIPEGAGGTGLGLSICKGLVEAHGGTVSAENLVTGGFRVCIELPLKEMEQQ